MTIRTRRILYSFFIAMFLLIAPPLVLYTAGFRYDFEYSRVVETGSLVVKSQPDDAIISINSEQHIEATPTIINTILPGKIKLLVKKEGYHDWEKEIEIRPRQTSFEENIRLFSDTQSAIFIQQTIAEYWFNEKQDKIAYLTKDNKLRLFNTLNQKDILIANFDKKPLISFSWSAHDDQFIFGRGAKTNTEYFIVDASFLERIIPLSQVTTLELDNIQWDPRAKNSLYALSGGNLYRIPYLLKTARLIYPGEITQYLAEEKRIIMITEQTKSEFALSWITPQDSDTIHLVPSIEISKFDKLASSNSHRISIFNEQTDNITIFDPSIKNRAAEQNEQVNLENVDKFYWTKDGDKLIYTDKFGIYIRNFNVPITVIPVKQTSQLIIKYSNPINEIVLSDDENYIFYTIGNTLRVAELRASSDPRSIVLLDDIKSAENLKLSKEQEFLAFIDNKFQLNGLALDLENARPFFAGNEQIGF